MLQIRQDRKTPAAGLCDARVSIRNVRRDGMDQVKKAKADGMSEDDQKFWESEVQDLTDEMIKSVDAALETKQAEIMQV